jgi:hypothetical protein
MAKPYSQDLRDRVIEAVERGKQSRRAAARHYEVSESVAIKWLERLEKKVRAAGLLHEWLWYPHDGELVNGGVFVHPTNKSKIFLLVDGGLAEAPLAVGHR